MTAELLSTKSELRAYLTLRFQNTQTLFHKQGCKSSAVLSRRLMIGVFCMTIGAACDSKEILHSGWIAI